MKCWHRNAGHLETSPGGTRPFRSGCLYNLPSASYTLLVLNPKAPIPLYRQLASELEDGIHSGKLAIGDRIPSEHELSAQHGIGRPTVRQATDFLVRRGLLERRRGSGTFVLAPRPEVDLFTLGGTIAAFEGARLELKTSVVEPVRYVEALGTDAGPLAHVPGFSYCRLGRLDQHPVLLERMVLSAAVFEGFEKLPVESESLSRLVDRHYHRRPIGGHQTLRTLSLSAREAQLLKVKPGHPALLVERSLDFAGANGAIFARIFALTDRIVLAQSLTDPLVSPCVSVIREEQP